MDEKDRPKVIEFPQKKFQEPSWGKGLNALAMKYPPDSKRPTQTTPIYEVMERTVEKGCR